MKVITALIAASTVAFSLAGCDESQPPDGTDPQQSGMSIVEIVSELESRGYGPIADISWEGQGWEVEAIRDGKAYEFNVDAVSGEVSSERERVIDKSPPVEAKPLSEILQTITDAGYTRIEDVSYEGDRWEIETEDQEGEVEIHVDPMNGTIDAKERD